MRGCPHEGLREGQKLDDNSFAHCEAHSGIRPVFNMNVELMSVTKGPTRCRLRKRN